MTKVEESDSIILRPHLLTILSRFKVANSLNETNFTIKLGEYQWKVHGEMLAQKSGFFRVLCNRGFQEVTTRITELHDHNPWDFARFLQFVYTGTCEIPSSSSSATMPLLQTMHQGKCQGQGKFSEKDERSKFEILSAMFHLATVYDVRELRDSIASTLVHEVTQVDSHIWTEEMKGSFSFELSAKNFCTVFDIIHPEFNASPKMDSLETRMVEFLAAAKILLIRQDGNQVLPVLSSQSKYVSPNQEVLEKFLIEIEECMDESPSFTKKYAKAIEQVLNKALLAQNWYVPKLKSFMPASFKPYERRDRDWDDRW